MNMLLKVVSESVVSNFVRVLMQNILLFRLLRSFVNLVI
jgi:hypothetical protein